MPSEKINDQTQPRWHTEVSWRRKPSTPPDDRGPAEGHVQLATVNLDSPFEFPDREADGAWEAGERFDGWRVTLDEAGIDRLIKALHKAKNQAFGPKATGGLITGGTPMSVILDPDEHLLRDVTTHAHPEQMWICAREDHAGQRCQERPYTWAEITAVPKPIQFKTAEVTVESDATAAARLDVDAYRRTRRGDR